MSNQSCPFDWSITSSPYHIQPIARNWITSDSKHLSCWYRPTIIHKHIQWQHTKINSIGFFLLNYFETWYSMGTWPKFITFQIKKVQPSNAHQVKVKIKSCLLYSPNALLEMKTKESHNKTTKISRQKQIVFWRVNNWPQGEVETWWKQWSQTINLPQVVLQGKK